MSAEDRLKLDALAEALGCSRVEVQRRGVRLLYQLLATGQLDIPFEVPIRVGRRLVKVRMEKPE